MKICPDINSRQKKGFFWRNGATFGYGPLSLRALIRIKGHDLRKNRYHTDSIGFRRPLARLCRWCVVGQRPSSRLLSTTPQTVDRQNFDERQLQ